jgi:type II secretory ATPase GspE/PulE/Tfp pilus assembly ATPase PilB-like protein
MKEDKTIKILLEEGYISGEDLDSAKKHVAEHGGTVVDFFLDNKIVNKNVVGQAMAEYYKVPFADLAKEHLDEATINLLPEAIARSKQVVFFSSSDKQSKAGMVDPGDLETRAIIEKKSDKPVKFYYITSADLATAIELYRGTMKGEFDAILETLESEELTRDQRDEIIVQMVDLLFSYGQQSKASDIHVEPEQKRIIVRFRIDGVMHEVLELPKEMYELFLTRIKILAKMRTDEHRAAQDGKLRFAHEDQTVDVRVSIVPIVEGENIVMRLLSAKSRQFDLEAIGLVGDNLKKIRATIKSPHGMILVTGPTGSGKTTTLYAVLKILNKKSVHISTIEDPVEYDIDGISQIQVNKKTELTFAKGLRAIVRQDPDIIMVGEIRDKETAGIAVNSSLTGHLVLSTLHTNDAATTLPRMVDMGVEPYLVASTVNIVIAQRLVRRICNTCRVSYRLDKKDMKILNSNEHIKDYLKQARRKGIGQINFYKGAGCKTCGHTGYMGRTGLFELLTMSDEIKALVTKNATSTELNKLAREQGMKSMLEDGLEKILEGETTLEEVLRVTKD